MTTQAVSHSHIDDTASGQFEIQYLAQIYCDIDNWKRTVTTVDKFSMYVLNCTCTVHALYHCAIYFTYNQVKQYTQHYNTA